MRFALSQIKLAMSRGNNRVIPYVGVASVVKSVRQGLKNTQQAKK